MKQITISLILIIKYLMISGQIISIGTPTPHPSAAFEINSSKGGILIPRMTKSQRLNIASPAEGLIVYQLDSTVGQWNYSNGTWKYVGGLPEGSDQGEMLYWDGLKWNKVKAGKHGQIMTFCDGVPRWGECPPKVGDTFGGGIVAYILQQGDPGFNPDTTHGLIVAKYNQTDSTYSSYYPGQTGAMWQQGTYIYAQQTTVFDVTWSRATSIGSGKSNTNLILQVQANTGRPFQAATLATNFRGGGYNDWYLPSKDELMKLYQNRAYLPNFTNDWYWSSTEKNDAYAEALYFGTGYFDSIGGYKGPGGTPYKVRAIRSF